MSPEQEREMADHRVAQMKAKYGEDSVQYANAVEDRSRFLASRANAVPTQANLTQSEQTPVTEDLTGAPAGAQKIDTLKGKSVVDLHRSPDD